MRSRPTSLLALLLGAGCQTQSRESACEELNRQSPEGVILATDERRCAQLLEFGARIPPQFGLDFATWLKTVPGQGARLVHETVAALTDAQRHVTAFESPSTVPCAPGLLVDDAFWTASPLSQILANRPEHLFQAFSLEIDADTRLATMRAKQDFDCDGTVVALIVSGEYTPGLSMYAGGWKLISSSVPEVDE